MHRSTRPCSLAAVALLAALVASCHSDRVLGPNGPLGSMIVTPSRDSVSMMLGATYQLTATVTNPADHVPPPKDVTWASTNSDVATVDSTGLVHAVSLGKTQVTASNKKSVAYVAVTVIPVPVAKVAITPAATTLLLGQHATLAAATMDSIGGVLAGRAIVWSSSDSTAVSVDQSGALNAKKITTTAVTISAASEGRTGTATVNVIPVPIAKVTLVVSDPHATDPFYVSNQRALTAATLDSIGGTLLGRTVSFASSSDAIATVSSAGVVTAVAIGDATITATAEGKSASVTLKVTQVPVASVAAARPTDRAAYYIGSVDTVTAATLDSVAHPLAGRSVAWTSSAPAIVEITSDGVFTARALGKATITATSEGKSASFELEIVPVPVKSVLVAIGGELASAPLYISNSRPLVVTPRDSADGTLTDRVVTLKSNDESIVTVDNAKGTLTAAGIGATKIVADVEGVAGEVAVTVVAVPVVSVTLDRSDAALDVGQTTTLVATPRDSAAGVLTGRPIAWSTSDASVAGVDGNGLVTAAGVGEATIAVSVDGKRAAAKIMVRAVVGASGGSVTTNGGSALVSIPSGALTSEFALTVVPTPAASLPANSRLVQGTAYDFGPAGTSFAVPVTLALKYDPASLPAGTSESDLHLYLLADGGHLQYVAGSRADATTHVATGAVTHFSTYLVAGPPAVASVAIAPAATTLVSGRATTLSATAIDGDGATIAEIAPTYASSDNAIATVNATSGLVVAHAPGTATITASAGGRQATATITVTPVPVATVEIDQDNQTMYEGRTLTFTASVLDDEGESLGGRVVTWSSSNPAAASVDPARGVVTANVAGSATISATSEGKTGTVVVTVVPVPIAGVQVAPAASLVQIGTPVQMSAQALDASGNVLADRAIGWSSLNTSVATVSPSGLVTTIGAGTATIRATAANGAYGEATVTIEAKTLVINEIMADPGRVSSTNPADADGEWFEIYNPTHFAIDMKGYRIFSLNDAVHTIATSVVVPSGGYAVFGRNPDQTKNGGVKLDYSYAAGTSTINLANNATDNLVIRDASTSPLPQGITVDSVINGTTPPTGKSRMLVNPLADNTVMSSSNWVVATTPWSGLSGGDYGTPGAPNSGGVTPPPPTGSGPVTSVSVTPTTWSMDAGLTKQFSATGRDATGSAVTTTFTWKSGDTTVATVSAGGLASGVTAGTATITATSANGIAATATLTVTPASTATGPIYRNHLEFGMPVDADPSDDYILTKPQYVVSYNRNRNLPNWVAWNLNATQLGTAPRCDCFSPDPQLPDEFLHVTTSDYTGSGYDRGHMVTSSQRNYSPAENAVTYLMTNILPQAPDNNQGPWEVMESYLTDLAKSQGKELYIVSGGTWSAGSKYLTNSTGVKIPIPDSTWKIVVIMPAGQGLANVTSASSIQVIAAMFPNVQGIRSVDWNTYRTTVRKIEQTTGYNFLSALPDDIEEMVETTP